MRIAIIGYGGVGKALVRLLNIDVYKRQVPAVPHGCDRRSAPVIGINLSSVLAIKIKTERKLLALLLIAQ